MKIYKRLSLLFAIPVLAAPAVAQAAVVINEVDWMGDADSSTHEWIELANTDATPVPLAGWSLTSSTGSPSIALTGTLAAHGYYLLERTSDASVPGVSADQIYSGALSNGGATLTLTDAQGTVVDTVVGGTDWQLGGNNSTKQTAQRQSDDTWTTADATPRAANATAASVATPATGTSSSSATSTPVATVGGYSIAPQAAPVNPVPDLYITAGPSRVVSTNADTPYAVVVYDSKGTIREDATVMWNFGDGLQEPGHRVSHTYRYPGSYLVIVHAHAGYASVSSAFTVRVSTPLVHIEHAGDDGIEVTNDTGRILDVSDWKLTAGTQEFLLPMNTALLPAQPVMFTPAVTGLPTSTDASLLYPDGKIAATYVPNVSTTTSVVEPVHTVAYATPASLGTTTTLTVTNKTSAAAPAVARVQQQSKVVPLVAESLRPTLPAATDTEGVLPASSTPAASSGRSLIASPWTASFLGILVASGAALLAL